MVWIMIDQLNYDTYDTTMIDDYFTGKKITVMGLGVAALLENIQFSTGCALLSSSGKLEFSWHLSNTKSYRYQLPTISQHVYELLQK